MSGNSPAPSAAAQRPAPRRIGDIVVELGYATASQIEAAISTGDDAGLQLGLRLLRKGIINETQLAQALSVRLGVGFTDLTKFSDMSPKAIAAVPERLARRYLLVPISIEDGVLTVAMASPGNVFAIDAVRSVAGMEVRPLAAPEKAIRQTIDRCYGLSADLAGAASEMANADEETTLEQESLDMAAIRNEADDAPVVKYVDSLITHAVSDRASDIHIEPGRETVSVRVRIDGRLRPYVAPPKNMQNAVISRIKILSMLDIAEKRLPLDGRMRAKVQGREIDLRVSTMPTIHGEKVVLRILDKTAVRMELGRIGAEPEFITHFTGLLKRQTGMILITGPTGSGKTTTLYAALNQVRDVTLNVISVEDPIEYEIEGVCQIPARPDIGLTFARALRSILRQDPDVIMVGEMRDLETLEIGIRSSLTGHLVLSTIHTNDAVSTVTRMINMGAEPYLIASTLISSIAQRLVRTVCPECKEEHDVPDMHRVKAEAALRAPLPRKMLRGKGCNLCGKTGYYGRTAVFEYFTLDDEARDKVTRRASEVELRAHQRATCGGSLMENALKKALKGITTVDEALGLEMSI